MIPIAATDGLLALFARYNPAIWPAQVVAYLLGLVAVALVFARARWADRAISAILAACWLWVGIVFLGIFGREIAPIVAAVEGALVAAQGLLFLVTGVARSGLTFRIGAASYAAAGGLLIGYALVLYPILGAILGHGYPRAPLFGVAPCPTMIFTCGLLLWSGPRAPKYLLIVPLLWAALATPAALGQGVIEDAMLPISALFATALLLWRDRGTTASARPQVHPA